MITLSTRRLTLTALILVTFVAMLSVFGAFYQMANNLLYENKEITLSQATTQVSAYLENVISDNMQVSDYAAKVFTTLDLYDTEGIDAHLSTLLETQKDLATIALVDEEGDVDYLLPDQEVKPSADIRSQKWFVDLSSEISKTTLTVPHVQNLFAGEHEWVISACRRISYKKLGVRKTGFLILDLRFASIRDALRSASLGSDGYLYIISDNQEMIYHPKQQLVFMGLLNENVQQALSAEKGEVYRETDGEQEQLVMPIAIGGTNWTCVGVAYTEDMAVARQTLIGRLILTFVVIGLMILVMSWGASNLISRPLMEMAAKISAVDRDNFDLTLPDAYVLEISTLSHRFNDMLSRIRRLMQEAVQKQKEVRNAEFAALQAQINPHFLYNTLDTIVRMIEEKRNDTAIEMVEMLARLFRLSISNMAPVVPVRDEVEHCKCYMAIQSLRYNNKFAVNMDVSQDTQGLYCPRLILQPIVENCIRHGIATLDEGEISVSARVEGERLIFRVSDNGLGMPITQLIKLRYNLDQPVLAGKKSHGIALPNIHQRLQRLYGPEYGLMIESEEDEGTCVVVTLPVLHSSD